MTKRDLIDGNDTGTEFLKGLAISFLSGIVIILLIVSGAPIWITALVGLVWLIGVTMSLLSLGEFLNRVSRK